LKEEEVTGYSEGNAGQKACQPKNQFMQEGMGVVAQSIPLVKMFRFAFGIIE
jgi:hypothetical protein